MTNIENIAIFLNDLADWLEDSVGYESGDEFDHQLNEIRYRAQTLFDELDDSNEDVEMDKDKWWM